MSRANYRAWDIDITSFPEDAGFGEQLRFLIGFGILAPSGHNSQPWEFIVTDDSIEVFFNQERSLSQSDPAGRQLLISIGCAIENIIIAGDYYGFEGVVHFHNDWHATRFIATISFRKISPSTSRDPHHLFFSVSKRSTNRGKYKTQLPPESFLKEISQLNNDDFRMVFVADKHMRSLLADVVNKAQIEVMDGHGFREELSHYIQHNFTKKHVGMPGFTLGIPAPVSLFASRLIKRVNLSRASKKQDDALLKRFTPIFVLICSCNDTSRDWMGAGRIFERIWLMATREGLACAPLAAGVQVGDYYKKLQAILDTHDRPQVFFRMGYPEKHFHHSPRLSPLNVVR